MFRKFNIWLFVAAVVVLPLSVFAVVNWYEKTVQKLPVLVSNDHRISDFKLTNQHGSTTTTKDWENKIVVADFFFTRCPSVCPKMTNSLKKVQAANTNNKDVSIASFTVDPENDSTAVLQKYVNRFQINENNWHLLTGSKKDIYRLARKSFLVIATDGDGGPDDFIHSDLLILVDKQKRIRGYYEGTVEKEVQQLIKDIKKLENEK
jgi:protein SCO1/2